MRWLFWFGLCWSLLPASLTGSSEIFGSCHKAAAPQLQCSSPGDRREKKPDTENTEQERRYTEVFISMLFSVNLRAISALSVKLPFPPYARPHGGRALPQVKFSPVLSRGFSTKSVTQRTPRKNGATPRFLYQCFFSVNLRAISALSVKLPFPPYARPHGGRALPQVNFSPVLSRGKIHKKNSSPARANRPLTIQTARRARA
jgi:hypothetical protein